MLSTVLIGSVLGFFVIDQASDTKLVANLDLLGLTLLVELDDHWDKNEPSSSNVEGLHFPLTAIASDGSTITAAIVKQGEQKSLYMQIMPKQLNPIELRSGENTFEAFGNDAFAILTVPVANFDTDLPQEYLDYELILTWNGPVNRRPNRGLRDIQLTVRDAP